ncbi:MAG: hypothetical protein ACXVCD_18480, partial [Pseudobdellovibrionaceae bacterium]
KQRLFFLAIASVVQTLRKIIGDKKNPEYEAMLLLHYAPRAIANHLNSNSLPPLSGYKICF